MFKIVLDFLPALLYDLNMFNKAPLSPKASSTRSHLLATALAMFRARGVEASTMRDLASSARMSLGSAYYYFPSKEAIIQAYFDDVQAEHSRRLAAALANRRLNLHERLRAAFYSKLDIVQGDRKLMGALFRYSGDPGHALSVFGEGTDQTRRQSVSIFQTAIGDERLPEDIRAILPTALWALHLAILLYFIYDASPEQQRTRRLVDGVLTLLVRVLALAKLRILKPVRGGLIALLRDAGLLSETGSPHSLAAEASQP